MIRNTKGIILAVSVAIVLVIMNTSCKHDAEWCNDKVITIDTSLNFIAATPQVDTINHILGAIVIDTSSAGGNAYVKANIVSRPYFGSIDGGKTWAKLPINDTTLGVGTYKVIIKDGHGCESQVYTQKITY